MEGPAQIRSNRIYQSLLPKSSRTSSYLYEYPLFGASCFDDGLEAESIAGFSECGKRGLCGLVKRTANGAVAVGVKLGIIGERMRREKEGLGAAGCLIGRYGR